MQLDSTHLHALFCAITKLADQAGEGGTEIFALAELGQRIVHDASTSSGAGLQKNYATLVKALQDVYARADECTEQGADIVALADEALHAVGEPSKAPQ